MWIAKIQKLNKEHRGKNYPTDNSFVWFWWFKSCDSLPFLPIRTHYKSWKSWAAGEEFNHSLRREYCYLFAHSIVHLMGYDHEEENERITIE